MSERMSEGKNEPRRKGKKEGLRLHLQKAPRGWRFQTADPLAGLTGSDPSASPRPAQQRPPPGSPCACAASHVTARLRPHLQPPASRLLRERPQLAAAPGQLRGMYCAGPAGLRRRACAARGDGRGSGDGGGCGDLGQVPRAPGAGAGDCLTWRGLGQATPGRPERAWRCGAGPPRPARG